MLDRLWDAYGAEAMGCGISLPEREDMRYVVDCFRLHKVIQSLSESLESGFPESTVSKLVDRGERLSSLILHRQKPEGGRRKTEDGRRKTEDGRRKADDRRRKAEGRNG
jgi:hypothetical protein